MKYSSNSIIEQRQCKDSGDLRRPTIQMRITYKKDKKKEKRAICNSPMKLSSMYARTAERLVRELDLRLVCVQLVDEALCLTDVSKFIGAALVCTASMVRLGESYYIIVM